METSENNEKKSQNDKGSNDPEERIHVELEAPADELVIKRKPVDSAVSKESNKTAEQAAAEAQQAKTAAEEAKRKAETEKQAAEERAEKLKHELEDKEEKADSGDPEVAGYKLKELAKAPLEPPEPESQEPKRYHKIMIIIGCAVAIFGLVIIWPFVSLAVGLAVIAIGGVIVAIGTLPRV